MLFLKILKKKMLINDVISIYYKKLYNSVVYHNKVISQGRTPEDLLNDVCLTALRKFGTNEIEEDEGLGYLRKTLYNETHFQYNRIKNEMILYTDSVPDAGYIHSFDI